MNAEVVKTEVYLNILRGRKQGWVANYRLLLKANASKIRANFTLKMPTMLCVFIA